MIADSEKAYFKVIGFIFLVWFQIACRQFE
jgi:hypothetical protein